MPVRAFNKQFCILFIITDNPCMKVFNIMQNDQANIAWFTSTSGKMNLKKIKL